MALRSAASRQGERVPLQRPARSALARVRRPAGALALVWAALGCEGSGSDIGPRLQPRPPDAYRVLVLDDAGRPVTGAAVSIAGITEVAATDGLGRARFLAAPSGVRLLTVDGTYGSATSADRLGSVVVSAAMPDGGELPYAIFLPDVAPSAGLTIPTGVLASAASLDDSATSGAIVTLGAGTSVGHGAATAVTLRTGTLAPGHLPGVLPAPAAGAYLWGSAAWIDPPGATFAPGVSLSMPNDLRLAAGQTAALLELDRLTGAWAAVGTGTVDSTGTRIEAPAGTIERGGLYAFATPIATTTALAGRIVDPASAPVAGALVRAGAARTRSLGDGTFALAPIPAVDAAGVARTIVLEVVGGRASRPSRATLAVALVPGVQQVPDLTLATGPVTDVRVQLITRGQVDPGRRLRASSVELISTAVGIGDGSGIAVLRNVYAGEFAGILTARPIDSQRIYIAEAVFPLAAEAVRHDVQIFSREQSWWIPRPEGGATAVHVVDRFGTGPVLGAAVLSGNGNSDDFLETTQQNGVVVAAFGRQATVTHATRAGSELVVSNFTIVGLDSARVEIPIERAEAPDGAFDPHGIVRGNLVGGGSGGSLLRRVRSTRLLTLEDWYEIAFVGGARVGDVPRPVDPAVTGGTAFELGVPVPRGNLAAVEGAAGSGSFRLQRIGLWPNLAPDPGSAIDGDIALDLVADTAFVVDDALTNLHPSMTPTDLDFDLAVEFADGTLVDVAHGIDGNAMPMGSSLELTLPALAGELGGATYYVALGGSAAVGGKTVTQHTMIPLDGPDGPSVRFLGVPDITAPLPGATVPVSGFDADFTVPPSTTYLVVRLRSDSASEVRDWTAVLPASSRRFHFRMLPTPAINALETGHTFTLSVTAARCGSGPLLGVSDAYRRIVQTWVGIGPSQRQVNAFSTTSIQIAM